MPGYQRDILQGGPRPNLVLESIQKLGGQGSSRAGKNLFNELKILANTAESFSTETAGDIKGSTTPIASILL